MPLLVEPAPEYARTKRKYCPVLARGPALRQAEGEDQNIEIFEHLPDVMKMIVAIRPVFQHGAETLRLNVRTERINNFGCAFDPYVLFRR